MRLYNHVTLEKDVKDMDDYDVQVGLVRMRDKIEDYKEIERSMGQVLVDSEGLVVKSQDLDCMKADVKDLKYYWGKNAKIGLGS